MVRSITQERRAERVGSRWTALLLAALTLVCSPVRAQCGPQWLSGYGIPGVNGRAQAAIMWDPDGPGPLPPRLVVGGSFTAAGDSASGPLAMWDGTSWSPLGPIVYSNPTSPGIAPYIAAICILPDNSLVVSGFFTHAGEVAASNIARFDGTNWTAYGPGISGVTCLIALPNGDLVAGGYFQIVAGAPADGIARWNGAAWVPMAAGLANGTDLGQVTALAILPNGDLVAGGLFTTINGVATANVARWNGSVWSPLGPGLDSSIYSLAVTPGGDVLAGGSFHRPGTGDYGVARWDGTSWSSMGYGIGFVMSIVVGPEGELFAGGLVSLGSNYTKVFQWSGTDWAPLGTGTDPNQRVYCIAPIPGGALYAGGDISAVSGVTARNIALWDGATWSPIGMDRSSLGTINALASPPNGDLIAGGSFTLGGGVALSNIARWDGVRWSSIGSGIGGMVNALTVLHNGDIVAGGTFTSAGGVPASGIARWDGAAWNPLGSGMTSVLALAVMPSGDLIAGGPFTSAGGTPINRLARWDGTSWTPLEQWGFANGTNFAAVRTLLVMPNGDLIAGGQFMTAGSAVAPQIARWNGFGWSSLGIGIPGSSTVQALAVLPNGNIVAGGLFANAGGIQVLSLARWNGTSWSALGSGITGFNGASATVSSLAVLASGDLVAAGNFATAGGVVVNRIARWNGSAWSSMGSGIDADAKAMLVSPRGELVLGGNFLVTGSVASSCMARWGPNTPWVAVQPVSRSASPGGTLALTAAPAMGFSNVTYQWRRNGVAIVDGPGGASSGGGTVAGSSGACPSPTRGEGAVLTIYGVRPSDAGSFDVIFTNSCGSVPSVAADVSVACYANCDNSTSSPILNANDFQCFLNAFAAADPYANCDGSTTPPVLNANDFQCFLNAFAAGCQ